jgi:Flp pilus assembly protein CpaB
MEATHKRSPLEGLRRMAATRRGAMIIAAAAAALAGIVLLAFITQYKDRVQGGTAERPALVANRLIPKGTSGANVISGGFFQPTSVQVDNLRSGALASSAALAGKVATHDIYPGEQLTAGDFAEGADPVRGQLTGVQRAVGVELDGSHGLLGVVRAGDKVDVLAGFNAASFVTGRGHPQLRTLVQDVLVLKAPEEGKPVKENDRKVLVVRMTAEEATELAFAADHGGVWFVLRPPIGAKNSTPSSVTLEQLLAGKPQIEVGR